MGGGRGREGVEGRREDEGGRGRGEGGVRRERAGGLRRDVEGKSSMEKKETSV